MKADIYDALFRGKTLVGKTPYVALYTSGRSEVGVDGYERQKANMGALTNGHGSNTTDITFGPLSGSGTAAYFCLVDAGGKPLAPMKELAQSQQWFDGDSLRFNKGDLTAAIKVG